MVRGGEERRVPLHPSIPPSAADHRQDGGMCCICTPCTPCHTTTQAHAFNSTRHTRIHALQVRACVWCMRAWCAHTTVLSTMLHACAWVVCVHVRACLLVLIPLSQSCVHTDSLLILSLSSPHTHSRTIHSLVHIVSPHTTRTHHDIHHEYILCHQHTHGEREA